MKEESTMSHSLRGAKSNGLLADLHLNGGRKEIEAPMHPNTLSE
jgi:hypothetical protein